jgi:hypothetical protein
MPFPEQVYSRPRIGHNQPMIEQPKPNGNDDENGNDNGDDTDDGDDD